MNVYVLTPTGARPEGLALLGEYLNAQTYEGPLTWVVVDDCDPATRIPTMRRGVDIVVVRPDWRWAPGMNTQAACMGRGLEEVPEDAVLFVQRGSRTAQPAGAGDRLDRRGARQRSHRAAHRRDVRSAARLPDGSGGCHREAEPRLRRPARWFS